MFERLHFGRFTVDHVTCEDYQVGAAGVDVVDQTAHVGCVVAVGAGVQVGELHYAVSVELGGKTGDFHCHLAVVDVETVDKRPPPHCRKERARYDNAGDGDRFDAPAVEKAWHRGDKVENNSRHF